VAGRDRSRLGRKPRWALALGLVALAVAGPAGCGRSAPDLSDFDRNADKLCTEAAAEQEELRQDTDPAGPGQPSLLEEVAESRADLARDLSELEPSEEQAGEVEAFVTAERRRAEATLTLANAEGGDPDALPSADAVREESRAHGQALRAARAVNLEECAERLTPDARAEIVDVLADAYSAADPDDRCGHYSERYTLARWGGDDQLCVAAEQRIGPRGQIEVFGTTGIADVFANAAAHIGPDPSSGFVELRLTFEGGEYKIDEVSRAGPAVAGRGPGPAS
jgi:hypothetical protein